MKEIIKLEFKGIMTTQQLHQYLSQKLFFPHFYGNNWDAFWDSITGIVELPQQIDIYDFNYLNQSLPRDAGMFKDCIDDYIEEFGSKTTFNFKS